MTTTALSTTTLPYSMLVVPASPAYTVRKYKQMETSRGVACTGELYRGSKKVAHVEDRGDGGMLWTTFVNEDATERAKEQAAFTKWSKEISIQDNRPHFASGDYCPDEVDMEAGLNVLLAEAEMKRSISRRRNALLIKDRDTLLSGEYLTLRGTVEVARMKDRILSEIGPDSLYWNRVAKRWDKVSDL